MRESTIQITPAPNAGIRVYKGNNKTIPLHPRFNSMNWNNSTCIKEVKEAIENSEYEGIWKTYQLFYKDIALRYYGRVWALTYAPSITLEVKTKDGEIFYLQHKIKIYKEMVSYGFMRESEKMYSFNVPIAIKTMVQKYMNEEDIDDYVLKNLY